MRGFIPSDFSDYNTYIKHHDNLYRAQRTSDQILDIWDSLSNFTRRNPGMYWEIQRLMHDAAQVGYETAIGKSHRSSDYDVTPQTLTDKTKCKVCKHAYYVYDGDFRCERQEENLPCQVEVKEFLE